MSIFQFFNTSVKKYLRDVSKTIAALTTQAEAEVRRILANLYIRGSNNVADYGPLVFTGDIKRRIPQAYGIALDNLGYMFEVKRRLFEKDEPYRQRILFAIKVSATKNGLIRTINFVLQQSTYFQRAQNDGWVFDVEIRESVSDFFDGVENAINSPIREYTSMIGGITIYITPLYVQKGDYRFARNIDYTKIYENSDFISLKETFETIAAAGIDIDRVVFNQPGASGNKGEWYAYKV